MTLFRTYLMLTADFMRRGGQRPLAGAGSSLAWSWWSRGMRPSIAAPVGAASQVSRDQTGASASHSDRAPFYRPANVW